MNIRLPRPARRSGFTLLELLTVLVVIAILAGMLFPVLNRTRVRAQELAAKELCVQVATAWSSLALQQGRMPAAALFEKVGADVKASGDDLVLEMSPAAGCVLNWWELKSPVRKGDVTYFEPKLQVTNKKIEDFSGAALDEIELWPADSVFERSFVQKSVGVFPPWVERELAEVVKPASVIDHEEMEKKLKDLRKQWGDWIVRVIIDVNGDGKLDCSSGVVPADSLGVDEDGNAIEWLPGSAAAWTRSKDGKRFLTSW